MRFKGEGGLKGREGGPCWVVLDTWQEGRSGLSDDKIVIVLAVAFSGAEFDAPKETGVTGSAWCDKLRSVFPWSGMGRPYSTIAKTKLQIEKCGILAPDCPAT